MKKTLHYDWELLRQEYITGDVSYNTLARKYNLKAKEISRRGAAEKWVEQRQRFRDEIGENFRARALARGEKALDSIAGITDDALAKIKELLPGAESGKEAAALMQALTLANELVRNLYGIAPEGTNDGGVTVTVAAPEEYTK